MLLLLSNAICQYTLKIFTTLMQLETFQNQMHIEELMKWDLKSDPDSLLWEDGRLHGVKDTISLLRNTSLLMSRTLISLFSQPRFLISLKALPRKTSLLKSFSLKVPQKFKWIFLLKWNKQPEKFTDTLTWEEEELKLNLGPKTFIDCTTIKTSQFHTD